MSPNLRQLVNLRRALGIVLAFLLAATACSSTAGEEAVATSTSDGAAAQGDPNAPSGVVYVTTLNGDVEFHDPSANSTGVLLEADPAGALATQVIPAEHGSRLLLMQNTNGDLSTQLSEISNGRLSLISSPALDSGFVICFDNHAGTDIAMGHTPVASATQYEINVDPVPFTLADPDTTDIEVGSFESPSLGCPHWSGDRQTSAAAQLSADGADPTTQLPINVELHVTGPLLNEVIMWDGCNAAPLGFSPDDRTLAVRALCSGDTAATAGIWLIDIGGDTTPRKIADGFFNAGAWHPDGRWIAAAYTPAPQGPADGSERYGLRLIDTESGDHIDAGLTPGASVTTVAWIKDSVHLNG